MQCNWYRVYEEADAGVCFSTASGFSNGNQPWVEKAIYTLHIYARAARSLPIGNLRCDEISIPGGRDLFSCDHHPPVPPPSLPCLPSISFPSFASHVYVNSRFPFRPCLERESVCVPHETMPAMMGGGGAGWLWEALPVMGLAMIHTMIQVRQCDQPTTTITTIHPSILFLSFCLSLPLTARTPAPNRASSLLIRTYMITNKPSSMRRTQHT
ncbi:hypothetical protein F4774DRAFT_328662 [Daldinia eschscholtzii]|nr:hypothetical protein F4774DRAFT_328662 [Daldinia eschscholtzii]